MVLIYNLNIVIDFLSQNSPIREESSFLPVQSSPKGSSYGDADFEYSWGDQKRSREIKRLPVVDCGDASRLNLDKAKHLLGASNETAVGRQLPLNHNSTGYGSNMPIPFLQPPLREEDVERINGKKRKGDDVKDDLEEYIRL